MAADFTIVQGDTEPGFEEQFTYSNGDPVDLTEAEIRFVMRSETDTEPVRLTGTITVTNAIEGKLLYAPSAADTANIGNYAANWHVTFAGGETQTFPTEGYLWVQVQPNLTATGQPLLVGLGELKDRIQIPANDRAHDEKLREWIGGCRPLIENLTGPVLPQVYDEWYEGGSSSIRLRNIPSYGFGTTPVFMLLAVSEYRGPIEYNLAIVGTPTEGSVYSVMGHGELGTIVRRTAGGGTYAFWSDPSHPAQSVHVVYYVGQREVPANVKMAAIETLKWWWNVTSPQGPGFMTAADQETAGRPMVALPYAAEALLAPTRRAPVCA
jgi:hypothetical protein